MSGVSDMCRCGRGNRRVGRRECRFCNLESVQRWQQKQRKRLAELEAQLVAFRDDPDTCAAFTREFPRYRIRALISNGDFTTEVTGNVFRFLPGKVVKMVDDAGNVFDVPLYRIQA